MDILEYLKQKYDLSPFICELIDKESLDRYEVIIELGEFDNVIEETVRKKHFSYKTLKSYWPHKPEDFCLKVCDKIVFKKIADDIKTKGKVYFGPKNIKNDEWVKKYPILKSLLDYVSFDSKQYEKIVKEFCLALFINCGPVGYKLLLNHLPIPSIQTIKKELGLVENVPEGDLRIKELSTYLTDNHLPRYVWLSEDATRNVSKVSFFYAIFHKTNRCQSMFHAEYNLSIIDIIQNIHQYSRYNSYNLL